MPSIEDLLRRIGPALTTELIAEMAKDGVSPDAARQRIARADDFTIKRLAGLRFPHNARFLYLHFIQWQLLYLLTHASCIDKDLDHTIVHVK